MPPAVTQDLSCAYCVGEVTLRLSDWPNVINADGTRVADDHPALQRAWWTCPYCERENVGGFPGRLAFVSKRTAVRVPTEAELAHRKRIREEAQMHRQRMSAVMDLLLADRKGRRQGLRPATLADWRHDPSE